MAEVDLTSEQRSQLEQLAEAYVRLHRAGKSPSIEDFVRDYPELEDDIRELFPVMLMLDQGRDSVGTSSAAMRAPLDTGQVGSGSRLGDYMLLHPIGQGGMGVVYEAEHITLHNRVAIKLLPSSLNRPKLRERFLREASAAAKMNHPHIVRVFGYGSEGNTHYYVMSLIQGVGLNQLLSNQTVEKVSQRPVERAESIAKTLDPTGKYSSATEIVTSVNPDGKSARPSKAEKSWESTFAGSQSTVPLYRSETASIAGTKPSSASGKPRSLWHWVASIGLHAADALAYAHDMGVVHRDVKPSNMMLDGDGKLFITDFGLAKIADDSSLTETGDVLGTLRYLPPEALQGKADERGDIYGLGLTLYELLAGEPAFGNSDRAKLFYDISKGDFAPIHKKVPKLPRDLAQIVRKATEPDPALRYATASAMRDDLRHFLAGEPIAARPASIRYRVSRWIARNRMVSVLAGCLFLILAATAATAMLSARQFRDLADEKQRETNAATSNARMANLNLLRVQLSDARGWATSAQVGQRVEGLNSLRGAIRLSRELGAFDQYRDQIHEAAVTLSALHDAPVVTAWQDGKIEGSYAAISFNGDLTEYVLGDYRKEEDCLVYRIEAADAKMIERIPLGQPCIGRIQFSSGGKLIASWVDMGQGKIALWVHDRTSNQSYWLDEHENPGSGFGIQIRDATNQVLYINSDANLAIFDVATETETTIELPRSTEWQKLALSHAEDRVAIFRIGVSALIIVDLKSHKTVAIQHGGSGIRSLAWRPDDRHLAIGTTEILIWDLSRGMVTATLQQENTYVNRLNYSYDGRLLFSSGWLSRTEVFDVMAERRIFRCESIVSDVSDSGNFAAFFAGPNVRIRQVVTSDSILEFDYSRLHRQRYAGVDCATGLLWLAPNFKVSAYDLSTNRSLATHSFRQEGNFVAVDPMGRDFFVSADHNLYRMPVHRISTNSNASGADAKQIRVGPPERLLESDDRRHLTVNNILLDSTGNRLGVDSSTSNHMTVLTREQEWKPVSARESRFFPTAIAPHPHLPLLVTNSHASHGIEVYNWETDSVLLSLPYRVAFANFSPDGRQLLVQTGGRLRVFDVGSWESLATSDARFSPGDNPPVVSHDSRWIALQTQDPRGIAVLAANTLEQVLFFRGHHLDPDSFVGSFDASGRFLIANRGQKVIAAWDLYRLRQFFESLELEWPLPGLGNPTPLRDPSVEVDVIWEKKPESVSSKAMQLLSDIEIGRWGRDWLFAPNGYLRQAEDWTAHEGNKWTRPIGAYTVAQIRAVEKKWLPELSTSDVSSSIHAAIHSGSSAFNDEDYQGCSEVYLQLLNQLRSRRIEREDAAIQAIVNATLAKARDAENTKSQDGKPWILRRGIDAILEVIREPEIE